MFCTVTLEGNRIVGFVKAENFMDSLKILGLEVGGGGFHYDSPDLNYLVHVHAIGEEEIEGLSEIHSRDQLRKIILAVCREGLEVRLAQEKNPVYQEHVRRGLSELPLE